MDLEKIKARKGEYADYMVDKIKGVISDCKARFSGSDGEKEAAYYLEKELKNYSDETKVESFEVHPNSFYGWAPWSVSFLLLAIVCLFIMPFMSIVFVVLALVPMLTTFIMYRTAFDKFYAKKESHNVTAVKMPKGEVKRAVYFSGHMDAAKEWTINYKFGGKVMTAAVLIGFLSIVYITAVAIYSMIVLPKAGVTFSGNLDMNVRLYVCFASLVFVIPIFSMYFLSSRKRVVDGANDNLSGCLTAMAILKAVNDNKIEFEHTKIGVILTGSEETGLRGAKAWAKAHRDECLNVPTDIYALDTITETEHLSVNLKDLNNTVKTSKELGENFMNAAKSLGVKCVYSGIPIGASDGAAFCQEGLRATSITAMNHDIPRYYHTRVDSVDALNKDALATVFEVIVEMLKNYE